MPEGRICMCKVERGQGEEKRGQRKRRENKERGESKGERKRCEKGSIVQKQNRNGSGYCQGGCCWPGPVPGALHSHPQEAGPLQARKGVACKSGLWGRVGLLLQ